MLPGCSCGSVHDHDATDRAAPMRLGVDLDREVIGSRAPVEERAAEGGDGYREEGHMLIFASSFWLNRIHRVCVCGIVFEA